MINSADLATLADTGWQTLTDPAIFIKPVSSCWLRVQVSPLPTTQQRNEYLVLQRSPKIDIHFFNAQGQLITTSDHAHPSQLVIEIGRRVMVPLNSVSDGLMYVRFDSSNRIFVERAVIKRITALTDGIIELRRLLATTMFAATMLLTSAMFIAAFGYALRDLDFGIYSVYTLMLGITLIAWDQIDLPIIGINYSWVWQLTSPLSTAMLSWLAIRFGKFHLHSQLVSRLLICIMGFNLLLFFWAAISQTGVPMMPMPFNRLNFENWQDLVLDILIMTAGWRGWRRGERDCLLLFLSLAPSTVSDLITLIWDPMLAPLLLSKLGYSNPLWLDQIIHFNGSLTWLALPLVFCFALARRSLLLHLTLIDERKRLEDRVLQRTHELHTAMKELELLATTDSLTGLANRRRMMDWISHEIDRSYRSHNPLALCMIDVDHFKYINDTYGHPCGDHAIVAIAKIINETIRKTDTASRFGGEEFVILMPETDALEAGIVIERLRAAIEAMQIFSEGTQTFSITASFGVAFFDHLTAEDSISKLLNRADKALYRAKNAGRNQVVLA